MVHALDRAASCDRLEIILPMINGCYESIFEGILLRYLRNAPRFSMFYILDADIDILRRDTAVSRVCRPKFDFRWRHSYIFLHRTIRMAQRQIQSPDQWKVTIHSPERGTLHSTPLNAEISNVQLHASFESGTVLKLKVNFSDHLYLQIRSFYEDELNDKQFKLWRH
jgi:hypothetical protein